MIRPEKFSREQTRKYTKEINEKEIKLFYLFRVLSCLLTEKGLMFTFNPYQVAAYAAGSPGVIIPFDNLKSVLRNDGIAAKFMK